METPRGPPLRRHSTVPAAPLWRGSCQEPSPPAHPGNLAHRRRSEPSLAFGKWFGLPWAPIREQGACWPCLDQCPFVLGLCSQNGELLLDQRVKVTEGRKTMDLHLFLFRDVLVFARLKSTASYRLKYRVGLGDVLVHSFNPEDEDEDEEDDEDAGGDVDIRVTLVLTWASTFCVVSFCSPGMKECWLDILQRKTIEARATSGVTAATPQALMKVLGGAIPSKALPGDGTDSSIEFPSDDMKLHVPAKPMSTQEDRLAQPIENGGRWKLVRRLMHSLGGPEPHPGPDTQLFGKPLSHICPDERSLPQPVNDMLVLLRTRGPATEGVFRQPGNRRLVRELREQLLAGRPVAMRDHPAALLASLLKCFLKEVPGSLLGSHLYPLWVEALDAEPGQPRCLQIKRVLFQLPVHNRLLLQQLLNTFQCILERSHLNKMDAHNLAVCTAPTLLQLPAGSLQDQKHRLQKVTELTEYLLQHSGQLLGEEALPLLPLLPPPLGEAQEEPVDASASQRPDSPYDGPDPDAEGSSHSLPCSSSANPTPCPRRPAGIGRRCSEPTLKALRPAEEEVCSHTWASLGGLAQPEARSLLGGRVAFGSASSTCSLESATSNLSEGSVFSSSPPPSPTCHRRRTSARAPGGPAAAPQGKRRSQSMKLDGLGSAPGPPGALGRPRPLSAIEVSPAPCRPPSYQQAVLRAGAAAPAPPRTVLDAQRERARPRAALESLDPPQWGPAPEGGRTPSHARESYV